MWLFLAFLAIPLIEIGLFVEIGGAIGLWPTLIWVILSAALGILVLRGVAAYGAISLSRDLREMRDPLSPLANRLLLVIGAGLLILPGFFTDSIGLLLLIPPVRLWAIRLAGRRLARRYPATGPVTIDDADWREVDPPANGNAPPQDRTRH